MRIGIDARLIEETGVGRYIRNLISELAVIDKANEYVVFLRQKSFDSFVVPNRRWRKVLAEVAWHSINEQFVMPKLLIKESLDLVHVPYHNPPIFYPGEMVVTIHDLTILHFDTGRATTLPLPVYKLKRLGYWIELAIGLRRARKIMAVSQTTKKEIIDHFGIDPSKIVVTYEGVEREKAKSKKQEAKRLIQEPYFLYVGNAYPHKNLEMLLRAFQQLLQGATLQNMPNTVLPEGGSELWVNTKLVLVGPHDFFYDRISKIIATTNLRGRVILLQDVSPDQLSVLYRGAIALVSPSLMEGFGLPGLEAMAAGTPVVASDIPVFREVYADAYLPFDPGSLDDIAFKLKQVVEDERLRKNLIDKGKKQVDRYSWREMAQQTLKIYESCTGL